MKRVSQVDYRKLVQEFHARNVVYCKYVLIK